MIPAVILVHFSNSEVCACTVCISPPLIIIYQVATFASSSGSGKDKFPLASRLMSLGVALCEEV